MIQSDNNALSKEVSKYLQESTELQKHFLAQTALTQNIQTELAEARIEKTAKHKFLAAALMFSLMDSKKANAERLSTAWHTWANQVVCYQMAETAFNTVLELNHKHSSARCQAGAAMLRQVLGKARLGRKALAYRAIKHVGMMFY